MKQFVIKSLNKHMLKNMLFVGNPALAGPSSQDQGTEV